MKKTSVLIFPAGGENAINIYDSLKYNLHFNLFGASSVRDYAEELYKCENYVVSNLYITEPNFINNFNEILKNNRIEYIIPTHDTIALFLMENQSKINAKIVCSPLDTARIANNKALIFKSIHEKSYAPIVYTNISEIKEYPVFLKPNVGAGGKGTFLATNEEELTSFLDDKSEMTICEYLPGKEFTIDCFTDRHGKLLFIGPRTRDRITMGISFKSETVEITDEINMIAEDLNKTFNFRGAWFFQVKGDVHGNLKLLEFSVRQAGTMALYRELGVNFSLLSLFDAMDMDVDIIFNNYNLKLNRRLSNSYKLDYEYNKVYIDFDDTLIVNNKVNTVAIGFLYQCLNKNKEIYLITKHEKDIYNDLKHYCIDSSIFKKIYLLKDEEKKYSYIAPNKAIFIDNYYKERKEVFESLGIPVFDVDAIECLIDYSEV